MEGPGGRVKDLTGALEKGASCANRTRTTLDTQRQGPPAIPLLKNHSFLVAPLRSLYSRAKGWDVHPTMQHTVTLDSKSRVSLARVGGRPGQKLTLRVDGRAFVLVSPAQTDEDDDWQPSITLKQLFRHKLRGWEPGRLRKQRAQRVRL